MNEFLAALINCSGTACGKGELQQLAVDVIQFMINLSISVAVLFFMWGGFLFLTSAGSEERISNGRKAMTAAVVGLVIVLVSWIAVSTFLSFFTNCTGDWWNPSLENWQC